jgi:hypothetical protein
MTAILLEYCRLCEDNAQDDAPVAPAMFILQSEGDVLGFNKGEIASEHNASAIIADRNKTVCQEFKSCRDARTPCQTLVGRNAARHVRKAL